MAPGTMISTEIGRPGVTTVTGTAVWCHLSGAGECHLSGAAGRAACRCQLFEVACRGRLSAVLHIGATA